MAQVSSNTRIILVTYAAWLRSRFVSLRFEFNFMNDSSFELCSDHFGVASLLLDRNWKAKFNKLVDVRRSSMLERLRRICCKSPHSAMLFHRSTFHEAASIHFLFLAQSCLPVFIFNPNSSFQNSISRCSGIDGLYSTAIEVHVLDGKRSLREWLTAMHARFVSEAFEMPKTPPCP